MSTYKNVTSAARVPDDIEYWDNLPRLKNPYKALDNAYRLLVGDGGVHRTDGRNMIREEVNFGNGVWVYKYRPEKDALYLYVPVHSGEHADGGYFHWVIEGPVATLPKALASALRFINSGVFTDHVAKSNANC